MHPDDRATAHVGLRMPQPMYDAWRERALHARLPIATHLREVLAQVLNGAVVALTPGQRAALEAAAHDEGDESIDALVTRIVRRWPAGRDRTPEPEPEPAPPETAPPSTPDDEAKASTPRERPWRWYLSARAVREYLRIAGLADDDGGPSWGRGERELAEHCWRARLYRPADHPGGRTIYRTGRVRVGRQSVRLEIYVQPPEPNTGPLDAVTFLRAR